MHRIIPIISIVIKMVSEQDWKAALANERSKEKPSSKKYIVIVVIILLVAVLFLVIMESPVGTSLFGSSATKAPVPKNRAEAQQAAGDLEKGLGDVSNLLGDIGRSLGG